MERDRELWDLVRRIDHRVSALETAETARGAIEKDRRRLLDSWLVRGIALAMLLMQAAALYLGARGR